METFDAASFFAIHDLDQNNEWYGACGRVPDSPFFCWWTG